MSADLLRDVLFRPTVQPAEIASAPPVRAGGTRTRAGNAMNRSRAALLAGGLRAVEVSGTKISMSQVATAAGVAKATLYNHFRTRDAVLSALLDHEVDELLRHATGHPLDEALGLTGRALSQHPVLLALARREPATVIWLARFDSEGLNWHRVRHAVEQLLSAANRGGVDTVLRWLASLMVTPGSDASIAADVAVLMAGLPSVQAPVDPFFALLTR
jgi:AcrR family transcriptional regulator